MKLPWAIRTLLLCGAAASSWALRPDWATQKFAERWSRPTFGSYGEPRPVFKRAAADSPFLNANTTRFAVNGTGLPRVNFDVGESYSGLLPIGGQSDGSLFFWFWPTAGSNTTKEILIWLNGGPGCSSLEGLLQENGPISWLPGTFEPISNPWSWHRLTNVVYIEQPVGTGFSTGTVTAQNEDDVAAQFMGFWKNFVDTFALQGYDIYVTGESYAGMYCPYIASNMLDANDMSYFNVKGMMINDPVIADFMVSIEIPTHAFVELWNPTLPFNDSVQAQIAEISSSCSFDSYLDQYLTFPASGQQPVQLPGYIYAKGGDVPTDFNESCDVFGLVQFAAQRFNPAWNVYQVAQLAPLPQDPLGFPDVPIPGQDIYFNQEAVKEAIHAPKNVTWSLCTNQSVFLGPGGDTSPPSMLSAIPNVIDRTGNVMISHGVNDMVLIAHGTLLAIQNMTWGGQMGFQSMPTDPLFVPFHDTSDQSTASGYGVLGTTHTERGLTWCYVPMTGHMIPQWQPAVSFRQVEFLLGRVGSLSSTEPLSIFPQYAQPSAESLGNGTAPMLGRLLNSTSSGGSGACSQSSGNSSSSSAASTALAAPSETRGWLVLIGTMSIVLMLIPR